MEKTGENFLKIHIVRWEEIPDIELYMDQVLNYIEKVAKSYNYNKTTSGKEEKIITKTMINNYVKQGIIAPPVNKKYGRLQIAELIVISILKEIYCINDIKKIIRLGIVKRPANVSYNKFCDYLEKAIRDIFKDNLIVKNKEMTKAENILKNIVQSYVNKLYVKTIYLNKLEDM